MLANILFFGVVENIYANVLVLKIPNDLQYPPQQLQIAGLCRQPSPVLGIQHWRQSLVHHLVVSI